MNDLIATRSQRIYSEFVDIIFPAKNVDFCIRGILLWIRENGTVEQKHDFLCYFYGEEAVGTMTGAYQLQHSLKIIYKDPFDKQALERLDFSILHELFKISGCNSDFFTIYFLEYKRVSKIRSRAYMNKVTKQRQEYSNFIRSIIEKQEVESDVEITHNR